MTDQEYKDREERLYNAFHAITDKAATFEAGRDLVNGAYKDKSERFRFRKHLNSVSYGLEEVFNLVGEVGKLLMELDEEYEEEEENGNTL